MYSGREFQMRAADGTKDLLWLTRLERGIWTAKSCDLTDLFNCLFSYLVIIALFVY